MAAVPGTGGRGTVCCSVIPGFTPNADEQITRAQWNQAGQACAVLSGVLFWVVVLPYIVGSIDGVLSTIWVVVQVVIVVAIIYYCACTAWLLYIWSKNGTSDDPFGQQQGVQPGDQPGVSAPPGQQTMAMSQAGAPSPPPAAPSTLPTGWAAHTDPATGRTYYVAPDQTTHWELPATEGAPPHVPQTAGAPQPKGRFDPQTGQENPKFDSMTGVQNW